MMNAVKCMQWESACSMHKVHRDYKNAEQRRDRLRFLRVCYAGRSIEPKGKIAQ
jgi:hypothetical protein